MESRAGNLFYCPQTHGDYDRTSLPFIYYYINILGITYYTIVFYGRGQTNTILDVTWISRGNRDEYTIHGFSLF